MTTVQLSPIDPEAASYAARVFLAEGIPSTEVRAAAATSPCPAMLHAVADAMDVAVLSQIAASMRFVNEVAEQIARGGPATGHDDTPLERYDRQAHLTWYERQHPDAENWPPYPRDDDEAAQAIARYAPASS